MDKSNELEISEVQSQSNAKINIPIEKFIKLIYNVLNKTKKSPLTRAQSEPTSGNWAVSSSSKRKSVTVPEIFIFPDLQEKSTSESSGTPVVSSQSSCSIDRLKDSENSSKFMSEHEIPTGNQKLEPYKKHGEFVEKAEILPLSLSYEDRQPSCQGVSGIYFKNIVNELVKTKKFLKDLQHQHKLLQQDKLDNDKLKKELHRLRFSAQHLQREHRSLTEQNKKLRQTLSAFQPQGMNKSFELMTAGEIEYCNQGVQTDVNMTSQHNGAMVDILQQQNDEFKKENEDLTQLYNELKNNVKILNSCLSEEKMKIKAREKELSDKEAENKWILSQLSRRRQEYDELNQEYTALKKNLNLYEEEPSHSTRSPYSSRSSGSQPVQSTRTSVGSHSGDQILFNIQPLTQTSIRRDGHHTARRGNPSYQNNLSSTSRDEHAPSNIQVPFQSQNSRESTDSSQSTRNRDGQMMKTGTMDTQPHEELICPTCLLIFQEDSCFLHHLSKCFLY